MSTIEGHLDLPVPIRSFVTGYVAVRRRQGAVRAVGRAVAFTLAWVLACCLVDRVAHLPGPVRLALLLLVSMSAGALAGGLLVVSLPDAVTQSLFALLLWLLLLFGIASAQTAAEKVVVVEGTYDGTAFGMGQTVRITGTVTEGAISLGGNVIVEGELRLPQSAAVGPARRLAGPPH